ncbi:MAG: hypothetical protein E7107_05680 [Prevotella sp.]|nr:hypothetical protein [Prevotella sp.]
MKKQIMMLMAVLLICTTSIAWDTLAALNGVINVTFVIEPEGAGNVLLSGQKKTSAQAFSGKEMTISAQTNPGYVFAGWYINDELKGTDASQFKFMTGESDMTVVAKFKQLAASTLVLAVRSDCEGRGTVGVTPVGTTTESGYKYTAGTQITVKAIPNKGFCFDYWEDANGKQVSTNANYTFNIDSDVMLYAVFSKLENYNADLISFPGCEGYGRFTTGGRMVDSRGSKVYYVTRLDDTGEEGTFRWAVTTGDDTPRTVLFKVSGTIFLTKNVDVKSNTTIAGQTAPGGGICLAGYRVKLGSNIIIRHLRFRAGDLPNKSMSPLGVENVENIVLDHCSLSWSMEENLTLYDNNNTTTQWCIFAEGLYDSRNSKGNRAYGAQWGGKRSTMHHCLFAHNNSRSPRFNGVRPENHDRQAVNEFTNNVIYNWGSVNAIYGGENSAGGTTDYNRVYMINNYYRPGPATKDATGSRRYWCSASGDSNGVGQWYLKGNKFELSSKWAPSTNIWKDEELQKVNDDNYYGFVANNASRAMNFWSLSPSQALADKALLTSIVDELGYTAYESADEAYAKVVTQAGASLPRYDEVDKRVLAEAAGTQDPQFGGARGSKSGIIDSPYDITLLSHDDFAALYEGDNAADDKEIDITCYPRLQPMADDYACQVVDTDGDGLPDAYETLVSLNPNDATDGMKLTESGYSNLEVFLNGVADGQIDAKKYTHHQPEEQISVEYIWFVSKEGTPESVVHSVTTIQEAVNLAPEGSIILIYPGIYNEHVQIDKPNLHLMGMSKQNTIITWDKTAAEGGVDNTATVNVTANDVSFDNLTIRNTRQNEGQALALYTKADRIVITSCNLEGWQDTYRTGKDGQRHLVRNSRITGTTDFIYGAGEAYFDADTLVVVRTSNVIVAPDHASARYGYVFSNCVIDAQQNGSTTALGRPWGNKPKVSFLNTRLTPNVSITAEGWNNMGGLPIQMAEYNTTDADGNAVDLSQRRTAFTGESGSCTSKAVLTPVETNSYKLDYVLRGTDGWDADWQGFTLPAPVLTSYGAITHWRDDTGFAQGYIVTNAEGRVWFTANPHYINASEPVTVRAFSRYGVLGEPAYFDQVTAIRATTSQADVVRRQYFTPDGRQVSRLQHGVTIVRETLSDGMSRTTKVVAK